MRAISIAALAAAILCGCAYKAEVIEAPSYNVVSSYGREIPGRWLLYVESQALDRPIKPSGYACSAHSFPIAASAAFRTSVKQTLDNVIDKVEFIKSPIPSSQLVGYGAVGMIVVRGEEVRAKMDVQPGFFQGNMSTEAIIIASITVDAQAGRVYGTTVEGHGFSDAESGLMCEGGARSLSNSVGVAMKDAMRKLGEGVTNSERVRVASSGS